jgi:galactoside O-acetyltransferase
MISQYYSAEDLKLLGIKRVGKNVFISKESVIVGIENIEIGDNVRIDSYNVVLAARGWLKIGSNVHIEPLSSIIAHNGILIGDFCTISHGVRLFTASADYSGDYFTNSFPDQKFQQPFSGPIEIRNHVIVGANSVVMPNVILGEGAAIGAMSFVRKSLEGWQVYAGNPLKLIRTRHKVIRDIGAKLLED